MNKELIQAPKMPMAEVMEISRLFAESGMFDDAKQVAQAFVKIHAGTELGFSALQSMSGIFIIKGKITVGAGLIANKIENSERYGYEIKELTNKNCSIDFFEYGKFKGNSEFSFDDAIKAGTQNMSKFPKNMLFSRAMSNGQKWYAAGVFSVSVYTPEEMGAPTLDVDHQLIPEDNISLAKEPVTKPEIIDYTNSLQECGSVEDLQAAWKLIPASEQPKYKALKDECKNTLTPVSPTEPIKYNEIEEAVLVEDVQDEWEEKIKDCKTLPALEKLWKSMSTELQGKYELLKDIQKEELTPAK